MVKSIPEMMAERPLVFDGAMGTMIYARGVFINTCYDELCLTNPKLIRELHQAYCDAGADVIETNTFGANPIKLREYGLSESVDAINRAGVKLAREAAGTECKVAGSVGPCLRPSQMWQAENREALREAFSRQINVLAHEGVDAILLETFVHIEELQLAAEISRATGLPVIASFSLSGVDTALGGSVEAMACTLNNDPNVDVIGVNCGVGPTQMYDVVERVLAVIRKPLLAMPNAGLPQEVGGRMLYMSSPEYYTEYARKFIELGARGVGGCCGTTPEHIRVAARAIRTLSGVKRHIEVRDFRDETSNVVVVPTAEKSGFAKAFFTGRKVTSIELLPPKSCDLRPMLEKSALCREHGVDAINIPDGPRASARVSPMVTAIGVLREAKIEPVLHYCCRDRNLIGMQSDLLGAQVAGVRNVLIITGDPPKLGDYPDATGVFDVDAIGLTRVVANLNRGRDVGGNPVNPPTSIFIGVGANPCAVSPELERTRYHAKLEAGAEFVITQPVFDAEALLRFLDDVERGPRRVPVLAGVWPLISFKNAEFMRNEVPGVTVPDSIMDRMSRCGTKEEGIRMGIEIAREICDRISDRVAGFQVSAPLGRVDIALRVLRKMD